jgi:CheY-like chemotaxis protein
MVSRTWLPEFSTKAPPFFTDVERVLMKLDHLDLVFPQEYLKATLMISLLTVWVLVGLFHYLNRYTKRDYFAIWTTGWLFYALWLTISLGMGNVALGSFSFMLKQCCVSLSAVFMLWGSLRFLGLPVRQTLFGMFMLFLLAWTVVSPQVITNTLQIQLPVFILLGGSSLFAGACFFRLRKQKAFVGAGMLSLGFLLWGIYLGTYPLSQQYGNLYSAGYFVSAVLQLFIAVSMIVLVLEEVRDNMVQKERLHAIGKMAIGMAHDVNNALCPITGYAELLLKTLPNLTEENREDFQKITEGAENVTRIVARMREVYRNELGQDTIGKVKVKQPIPQPLVTTPVAPPCANVDLDRSLHILYIDDEPKLRELLRDVLELNHHRVTVAASGKEGLELFRTNLQGTDPYEVVITDFGMPEMDGRHVARALRAESPLTPIVMLTGWGTMMKADGEVVPEVDAVVGKPPHMQELNNLLFQVAGKHN